VKPSGSRLARGGGKRRHDYATMCEMEENPYKAPVENTLSTSVSFLPCPLALFLMTLSSIAAAWFVFMAVAGFCDATWTHWQPPWELGTEGEPAMILGARRKVAGVPATLTACATAPPAKIVLVCGESGMLRGDGKVAGTLRRAVALGRWMLPKRFGWRWFSAGKIGAEFTSFGGLAAARHSLRGCPACLLLWTNVVKVFAGR
jgi:hypothetical protein